MDPKNPRSPDEYKSVAGYGEAEFIIEKSRFIGYALPVSSEEEARAFIAELRELHPQATHVCSAWIIGAGGLAMRFSDDGEPSGTAGVPMLEVLKKEGLTDIVCGVVVHYHLFIPADAEQSAAEQIAGWTNGKAALDWGEVCYKGRK